jgi:predicted nucleotidyltransferase
MTQSSIPSLLKTLQIPTKIHTVHLVGSRLWGTHSPKSDFDLLIVVADPSANSPKFQTSQHKGQYDATLLTESEFHARVEEGSLIETLCCLIPASEEGCVLVHDDDDEMQQRGLIGKGHLQKMRIWADERGQKDLEKASKFWAKGGETREKGWKILRHIIAAECILRALQRIVDEDKIDLREVNLTQETLQRLVGNGREDDDAAWMALSWEDVQVVHRERLESNVYIRPRHTSRPSA